MESLKNQVEEEERILFIFIPLPGFHQIFPFFHLFFNTFPVFSIKLILLSLFLFLLRLFGTWLSSFTLHLYLLFYVLCTLRRGKENPSITTTPRRLFDWSQSSSVVQSSAFYSLVNNGWPSFDLWFRQYFLSSTTDAFRGEWWGSSFPSISCLFTARIAHKCVPLNYLKSERIRKWPEFLRFLAS
jgi:hypothetical protein